MKHESSALPAAGNTTSRGPVLPDWGARVTLCPEPDGNRTRYRLRVIAETTKYATAWTAVVGSRHAALDLATREGWHLDEEACA